MRILIIDDEDDIRMIVRYSLSGNPDIELLEAESAATGIRMAREHTPDLILLDLMMPVMDGRATLVELRRDPETHRIPVILLTANRNRKELDELRRLGARAILSKPFDPRTLNNDILSVLAG